jgi:hypothetical protein
MKQLIFILICCLITLITQSIKAQKNAVQYLDFGLANAEVLTKAYLDPLSNMVDANLNAGWNMSPRVMRKGRFSIHYFSNQSLAKSNKELFNMARLIDNKQLSGVTLVNPQVSNAPTAIFRFKEGQELPALNYNGENITVPNGEDISNIRMHSLSATVGISFNTDISIRFSPPLEYADLGKSHMWGLAIKHSLIPYFNFLQKHPFLETSLMVSYSQLKSSYNISYKEQSNQSLDLDGKSITGRFLIGAHFNVVDLFGSIGYGSRSNDISFIGSYNDIPDQNAGIKDPIALKYDLSSMEYEAGIQVRIYFINLQASYAYGNYGVVSLGAGISFR